MTLYLVTGPPAAGKSTWVREHAKPGDITIDFDALANVLTPAESNEHVHPPHVREVTWAARKAAVDRALAYTKSCDVYIIHTMLSDKQRAWYDRLGAQVVTVDPGIDVVLQRCANERQESAAAIAREWYAERDYIPLA